DLVDSTDFLPTICEAAGVAVPLEPKIDGHSFLAQARGEKGTPREWIYSWYSPNQGKIDTPKEFTATQRYKLYRGGEFYDYEQDPNEQKPLDVKGLDAEATATRAKLQHALDQYKDARPARLAEMKTVPKKKAKD